MPDRGRRGAPGWPLGLLLAAASAGATPAEPPPPVERVLDIVWVDVATCDPAALRQATEDVRDLFAPLGILVASRLARPGVSFPRGMATVVVKASTANPQHAGMAVAGEVSVEPGAPAVVQVFSVPLARALGLAPGLPSRWTPGQRRAFAHAVALVVAHELGHLVGLGHEQDGFMAPAFDHRQLRRRSLPVADDVAARFRSAFWIEPNPER